MEPIRHTKTARLRSLKMYRPELDEFVGLFQKSCTSVVISDKHHSYNSLDEMRTHIGIKIRDLDIRGEKPGLHFLLNQREYAPGSSTPAIFNELRTEEITEEADALFLKVKEFLSVHQRPSSTRFVIPAIAGLVFAYALTFRAVMEHVQGQPGRILPSLVGCMCFSIFFVILGIANSQNRMSLETKSRSPSFFVRNREEFAKHAVTAGISTLIAGVIGYCLGHFLK